MTSSMLLPVRGASAQALREVRRDTPLRRARTCYGHLAGVAGVALMDALVEHRWVEAVCSAPGKPRIYYALTGDGAVALRRLGVAVPAPKGGKPVAFSCVDWTERRIHLGGPLGRAIVDALVSGGLATRVAGSRVVQLDCDIEALLGSAASNC